MTTHPTTDLRSVLLALTDPIIQAARLVLALDERQPDALRAEALTMPAERLCWTLTQLDSGLPLALCQALVRAVRLSRSRRPVTDTAETTSAELATTAAASWLRQRWVGLIATTPIAWLGATSGSAWPSEPAMSWLDLPPLVGPLPGAEALPSAAGLLDRLRAVWWGW